MSINLNFLPNLVSLYQRGLLVPFIGSGMSRPACTSWNSFIAALARPAGMIEDADRLEASGATVDSPTLYRIADTVVHRMHALPHDEKARRYRAAIQGWSPGVVPEITPNLRALTTGLYWPLVLTTNYDDLYWAACNKRGKYPGTEMTSAYDRQVPQIVGRSLEDCHSVLRSLDRIAPPLYWALQGFLGGQLHRPDEVIPDAGHRAQLESQIVVGHQQYQQAINGDIHFRRAFAEVFRRRSFFFLGSGILEDYLLNLISEIIYNHGPSAYPHFALLPNKERDRFDVRFLQTRLGITPLFTESHEDVADFLSQLQAALRPVWSSDGLPRNLSALSSRTYTLAPRNLRVLLSYRTTPQEIPANSAIVVSAGRRNNLPVLGNFGTRYLEATNRVNDAKLWKPLDSNTDAFVFQYNNEPIFAIAARRPQGGEEYRDLAIVPEAVAVALGVIEPFGFTKVFLGSIASGFSAKNLWHPIHPFAQTLRGIRRFEQSSPTGTLAEIEVCLVDPRIWAMVASDKLPIQEMLCAEFYPFTVELHRSDGHVETYNLLVKDGSTVKDVLDECQLDPTLWKVALRPRPTDSRDEATPLDQIVTATMSLVLSP